MTRVGRLLVVVALASATAVSPAWAKGPKNGVFGSINGKKFKATNVEGVNDHCVSGIYNQTDGVIVFSAIECKPHRRRQGAQRRNYKVLAIGCNINYLMPGPTTLPLVVFSRVRLGLNPEMNALATLFIALVTVGVIAANYFMQRSERRRLAAVM